MKRRKEMNTKFKFGFLFAMVALILAPGALAVGAYVTPLNTLYGPGLSCDICHVNPSGGGTRTAYGTLFNNQANHMADPTTALTTIGSPNPAKSTPPVITVNDPTTSTVSDAVSYTHLTLPT